MEASTTSGSERVDGFSRNPGVCKLKTGEVEGTRCGSIDMRRTKAMSSDGGILPHM